MDEKSVENQNNKYIKQVEKYIGNSTTNGEQLNTLGKQLFGDKYLGTYSADTIPHMKADTYAIVNLDKSDESGSHWVTLIKTKNDELIVYDSYGRKTFTILPDIQKQTGDGVILESENDAEQSEKEKNCGARCFAAILIYKNLGKKALLKL